MVYQLDLFSEEQSEEEFLREQVALVRESSEKVRRSLFARHNELARKYLELHERMQIIEHNLCRGVR